MLSLMWWLVKVFIIVIFTSVLIGWLYGKTPAWFKVAVTTATNTGLAFLRKWIGL